MFTGGQRTIGTIPVLLFGPTSGAGQFAVSASGGTVFAGFGISVSSANGFAIPSGGLNMPLFQGSADQLWVVSNGSPSVVSWFVSGASAQTGA